MSDTLLVRDVMRIGVATCRLETAVEAMAAQMIEQGCAAMIVLDDEGDSRGWVGERQLAAAYARRASSPAAGLTAADIMEEAVPECPADIPLSAAVQLMADAGADHLFCLHRAAGQAWPASAVSLRDVVRALAGPEYIREQGAAAQRPTPMDLYRRRYGLATG